MGSDNDLAILLGHSLTKQSWNCVMYFVLVGSDAHSARLTCCRSTLLSSCRNETENERSLCREMVMSVTRSEKKNNVETERKCLSGCLPLNVEKRKDIFFSFDIFVFFTSNDGDFSLRTGGFECCRNNGVSVRLKEVLCFNMYQI